MGTRKCGVFTTRGLQFNYAERQAIHEYHNVWPPIDAALDHRELASGQPIICSQILEIDQANLVAPDRAILGVEFDVYTLHH